MEPIDPAGGLIPLILTVALYALTMLGAALRPARVSGGAR
jgi:hypothetical protein